MAIFGPLLKIIGLLFLGTGRLHIFAATSLLLLQAVPLSCHCDHCGQGVGGGFRLIQRVHGAARLHIYASASQAAVHPFKRIVVVSAFT